MAKGRINPNWIDETKAKIESGEFQSIILSYNPAAQWLIAYLANKGIPTTVINLGAGVKRITLVENICLHCKGTGKET